MWIPDLPLTLDNETEVVVELELCEHGASFNVHGIYLDDSQTGAGPWRRLPMTWRDLSSAEIERLQRAVDEWIADQRQRGEDDRTERQLYAERAKR